MTIFSKINSFLAQIPWNPPPERSAAEMDKPFAGPTMFELEQRVLYDASPLAAVMQPNLTEPPDISDLVIEQVVSDGSLSDFDREVVDLPRSDDVEAINLSVKPDFDFEFDTTTDTTTTTDAPRQLVVVDSTVDNYQLLISSLDRPSQVLILDGKQSGIEQISRALNASEHSFEAVHVVSHGNNGGVQLGNQWLDSNSLPAVASEFSQWGHRLSSDADLLFYGCNLAETGSGEEFINSIAALTGADVAASDDVTGHAALGGDWEFEYVVGTVETELAFSFPVQQNWHSALQTVTVTVFDDAVNGNTSSINDLIANDGGDGISLREAILASNSSYSTPDTIVLAAGTYTLDDTATGHLTITSSTEIIGAADGATIIDATGLDARVFQVETNTSSFQNLTIFGGHDGGAEGGGGLQVGGSATAYVDNVEFISNTANVRGGAISSTGTLFVSNTTIAGGDGGLMGGGVALVGGTAVFDNVTIVGNTATEGGGIYVNSASGQNTFTNVTISGNAGTDGGGFRSEGGNVLLQNVTITDNTATSTGGGISRTAGTVNVVNSIVAGNTAISSGQDLIGTISSGGSNIIGDDGGDSADGDGYLGSDLLDQTGLALGPLADNGAAVENHELLPSSVGFGQGIGATPDVAGVASIFSPASVVTNEDSVLVFSGANLIRVNDGIATDLSVLVELSVANGWIQLATTSGLTTVAGNGTESVLIEGLESDVNAALNGLLFSPYFNYNGATQLDITSTSTVSTANGLKGFYTFENGNANDQASSDNNGIFSGATIITDGDRGDVASFSGNDQDTIRIPGRFGEPASITLSTWVNSSDTNAGHLIDIGNAVFISLTDTGTLTGTYQTDSNSTVSTTLRATEVTGLNLANSGWTHIAYTVDSANQTQTLYVNGQAVSTTNHVEAIDYGQGLDTYLGTRADGATNSDFAGLLDDVRVHDRALNAEEAEALFAGQTVSNESVGITVTPVNDDVVLATNITATVIVGSTGNVITTNFLEATDVDSGDNLLVYTVSFAPTNGTLRLNGAALSNGGTFSQADINAGSLTYDHNGSPTSSDSFDFQIDDGGSGISPLGTFNFNVTSNSETPAIDLNGNAAGLNNPLSFTENGGPASIAPDAVIDDFGEGDITSMTIVAPGFGALGPTASLAFFGLEVPAGTPTTNRLFIASGSSIDFEYDGSDTFIFYNQLGPTVPLPTIDLQYVVRSITFQADSDTPQAGTFDFQFAVEDNTGQRSAVATSNVTVTPLNDAPVLNLAGSALTFSLAKGPIYIAPAATIFDEELSAIDNFGGSSLSIDSNGANDLFGTHGIAFSGSEPIVVQGVNIGTIAPIPSGIIEFEFNSAATNELVNEFTQSLTYEHTGTTPSVPVEVLWTFDDGNNGAQGSGGALTVADSVTINIAENIGMNAPASVITAEETAFVFDGANVITIEDGFATGNALQVTLEVGNGVLNLGDPNAVTIIGGADGTSTIVIEGTESELNASLNGLTFTPDENFNSIDFNNGPATLTITTTLPNAEASDVALVGRYSFDNGTATDLTGSGNDGTFNGTPTTITIDGEQVLSFAEGDSVTIPGLFGEPSSVTLSAWVQRTDSGPGSQADIISIGDNIALRVNQTGRIIGYYYDADTHPIPGAFFVSDASLAPGGNHLAVTVNESNTISIYVDGVLVGDQTFADPIAYPFTGNTAIGAHGQGQTGFDFVGHIDNVQIYTRALNAQEIQTLATGQTSVSESVAITITGTNDAPNMPADVSVSVAEDTMLVGMFVGTDIDGDSLTYSLAGSDAGLLNINSSTGEVSFQTAPNFEAPADFNGDNQYDFIVIATDNGTGNLTDSQNVSAVVTDVNDAPQALRQTPINVGVGQSVAISSNELSFSDSEQTPHEVYYLLTGAPLYGVVMREAIPLFAGDSFTQADVSAGLVSYSNTGNLVDVETVQYRVLDGVGGVTDVQSLQIDIGLNVPGGGTDDTDDQGDRDDEDENDDAENDDTENEEREGDSEGSTNDNNKGDTDNQTPNVPQPVVRSPLVASAESLEQFAVRMAAQRDLSADELISAEILYEIEDAELAKQILIGISAERVAGQAMDKFDSASDSAGSFARDAFALWKQLEKSSKKSDLDLDMRMTFGAITVLGTFGGILWALRGSTLMAVAFTQLPSWNFVDPLPILDGYYRRKEEEAKEDLTRFF